MRNKGIYITGSMLLLIILAGCSVKKNTAGSRFYHSFTTRYNVYFNGNQAYKQGVEAIESGNKDSYLEMIPLYPIENKKTIGLGSTDFDRAIEKSQKAIKLHSIKKKPVRKPGKKTPKQKRWLAQKEYNPFLHNAWMLMGKAQFNKGQFLEAASTFSYIARLYNTDPKVSANAKIWLSRCYTEMDWFYDADDVLTKLNNDSLPSNLIPAYSAAYGNYLLRQKRFKEAAPYLLSIIKNEKQKKQKAREYYLLGQVYQEMGDNAKAFAAYGKVSGQNPPYELEFNAKIKQTEVVSSLNGGKTIKSLQAMARSVKNKDYLDQVYYAQGNVYLSVKDTARTIELYKKGGKESTRNGLEKGVVLLKLGDLYWERTDYVKAQDAYKQAIGLINKEFSGFEKLNKRSEVLDELVKHVVNVQLQDSLQHLASLSEGERRLAVDKIIKEVRRREVNERKEAERQELMQKQEENMGNQMVNRTIKQTTPKPVNSGDKSWYFYNTQLVEQGKNDFQRKWGRRKLEDNWRRRNKTVISNNEFAETNYSEEAVGKRDSSKVKGKESGSLKPDSVITDNKNPEFYLQQIPLTEPAMKESNDILSDGLFNMGLIYKDKLEDFSLAQKTFTRLYTQFPHFGQLDEVYYNLYLMSSRWKKLADAAFYKGKLITEFPKSKYAVTIGDPDYAYNATHGKHLEDSLYVDTYAAFQKGEYAKVMRNYEYAQKKYAMGQHIPKFMFLNAIGLLQTGEQKKFMTALKEIVDKYPKNEITELAANIIKGLQDGRILAKGTTSFGSIWNRRKTEQGEGVAGTDTVMPKFSPERNTSYLFILAYEEGKVNENLLLYEVARYNFSNFIVRNFDLSFVKNNGIGMLQVKEFINFDEAYQYTHLLYKDKEMAKRLSGMRAIIISRQNYELLSKYYSFDDYLSFYKKHFSEIPELQIKGYTLDEPVFEEENVQEKNEE
ncbi:tetratricopeptide repeat protein [uncultured Bacteroides sp.]|uniref:type IX secretion system periplasmic lipoprotein PorW/SprE n=1 Tax=uncultured Bacteroides sp. TaxID=162156 RepID=UPI002AAA8650|nr:tetratricopeptide repeat protein [uncultured Bacteroides sp.]